MKEMNEVGRTVYTISGTTLENDKRKTAAKEALAAIKMSYQKTVLLAKS
ncbi:hypothetical protein [Dorea sp. AGR2135]|nr:hypothetical protein [Dorea sp. AGR2135]